MSLSFASIVALTVSSGDASAAVVGPDASGYLATDQAEFPPGSLYNYVDIQLTGVVVAMGANGAGSIPLGAPFVVYGAPLLEMVATSHGILTDDLGAANDVTNDCPLPDPPSVGRGFRIYPLHDVPVTTVFYQYFTEAEAAALGFPMQPAGVSVFQWVGGQNPLEAVDFEVVLFHSDDSFLMMVAEDANSGSSSTVGIQNAASTLGLTYQCNTAGGVIPATTAVLYTAGNPPDSDCCSPSATNTPGCTNPLCQEAVCAADSSCCGTEWDASCGALAATQCPVICGGPPPLSINEIRISQPGADDDEYVEIAGPPGTGLTDLQYVVIGDFPTGEVETVVDLTGSVIPPSGSFLMAEPTFSLGPIPDLTTSLNLENLDTVTHLLVGGMTASVGDNLDVDADGILDFIPWSIAFDTVVFIHPSSSDLPYGPGSSGLAGPNCQQVDDGISSPSHAFRCPDATGVWQNGDANQLPAFTTDSPGSPNPCTGEICGNGVVGMGEDCDDMGESAACDANCTFATCGDGVTNMAAGEACDDAGESAMCNADCSAAMCGDGIVNTSAAEDCDGNGMGVGGETAMCDVDCTTVMCGDGVVNPTAGETCDDGGRSDMCDADCTTVDCGDGLINISAGEQCDGDGMGMGGETATCDGDCTDAMCGDGVINTTAGEDCDDMGE
ncbi:MAG: hypothetical protein K0V04_20340, partial [Deltaproteobacteria bacterium]|nr:hypothetical protein [Deltaproteobacteria bacterium]